MYKKRWAHQTGDNRENARVSPRGIIPPACSRSPRIHPLQRRGARLRSSPPHFFRGGGARPGCRTRRRRRDKETCCLARRISIHFFMYGLSLRLLLKFFDFFSCCAAPAESENENYRARGTWLFYRCIVVCRFFVRRARVGTLLRIGKTLGALLHGWKAETITRSV